MEANRCEFGTALPAKGPCPKCGATTSQNCGPAINRNHALLWAAWKELNAIKARDGAPTFYQYGPDGPIRCQEVSEEYFGALVDALAIALGADCQPWPSDVMKPYLASLQAQPTDQPLTEPTEAG